MPLTSFIGFLAAILTTSAFIPQAYKTIRTRNTKGLSLFMYLIFSVGVALWLVYGIRIGDVPVIIANAVTLVFALIILYFKLRYK
ncbi:MAG: SemiSWEET transporter [Salinivirgaceae bacterium]|nr:SemiSWEET transporter [Salinivirgaceae bacterium]